MVFLRKREWKQIQERLDYLQNWKDITLAFEEARDNHISRLENDLAQIEGWMAYLRTRVEDYDGLILDYMEQEEQKNADR